jgi:hypothetical protein
LVSWSAALLTAKALWAQPGDHGGFRGTVVDGVTRRPVSGASVAVGDKLVQRSDSGGQFRFASLSPGEHLVHLHFLGYEDATERIAVRADSEIYRTVVLTPLPAILREVVVSERVDAVPQRIVDAYNRAAKANGCFSIDGISHS